MLGVAQHYKLLVYQMQLTEKWEKNPSPSFLPLRKHLQCGVSRNLAGWRELAEWIACIKERGTDVQLIALADPMVT